VNILAQPAAEKQALVDAFYWYQTIDLGDGVRSQGTVDHGPVFRKYGFPTLTGRSVLDVGASDGYFAFEFERLGASRVLALDIDRWSEEPSFDLPPRTRSRRMRKFQTMAGEEAVTEARAKIARELGFDRPNPFHLARQLRGSSVEFRYRSIYDLGDLGEQFDLVFVGTVTSHLQDISAALEAVRQVTKHQAVVACASLLDPLPLRGVAWFCYQAVRALRLLGRLNHDVLLARESAVAQFRANEGGTIWEPSVECIREMLLSAGFRDVVVYSRFSLRNIRRGTWMKHVVFHAFV
jgi:2-polyprenyl-3-methyl-5-hydroxy-6-metoxy-1,4-benzoquinol methylase